VMTGLAGRMWGEDRDSLVAYSALDRWLGFRWLVLRMRKKTLSWIWDGLIANAVCYTPQIVAFYSDRCWLPPELPQRLTGGTQTS
jgi:hypothetical protein